MRPPPISPSAAAGQHGHTRCTRYARREASELFQHADAHRHVQLAQQTVVQPKELRFDYAFSCDDDTWFEATILTCDNISHYNFHLSQAVRYGIAHVIKIYK